MGLNVTAQVPIPVVYGEVELDLGFRLDLLINDKVIVEIKSVESLAPVHHKQLNTYLKITENKLGLLVNFNTDNITTGITRIVNNL
jgi:GxxExxY protein